MARDRPAGEARSLKERRIPADLHELDPIFHPRSVAVVGVSSREGQPNTGGGMGGFFGSLIEGGFDQGRLYPVNPKVDEVRGLRCYPSLTDCPDPVDHIICQIPAPGVPALVDEAIAKGVRSIHFFTAGFSETGDAELAAIEAEIVEKCRVAGIRLIGPNCMGLYVPGSGLAFMSGFPTVPGNVFLLSQSGANAGDIVSSLTALGVRMSKAVSYGNGADLRASHFLEYAASDPQSEVVTAYIEGVQDGRAFFEALRLCAAEKPTIVLKGGITDAGARAANSHTGSLAGSVDVFEAACRQAGAIRARTLDELVNLVIASTSELRNVRGNGVALIAGGGGFSVLSSDQLALEGLDVPPMSGAVVDELREFIPVAGTSVNNPIDANLGRHAGDGDTTKRLYRLVAGAPGIDMVFTTVGGWGGWDTSTDAGNGNAGDGDHGGGGDDGDDGAADESPEALQAAKERRAERRTARARASADELADLQEDTGVPFVAIMRSRGEIPRGTDDFTRRAHERGLAVFPSLQAAAATVARLFEWRGRREGLPPLF